MNYYLNIFNNIIKKRELKSFDKIFFKCKNIEYAKANVYSVAPIFQNLQINITEYFFLHFAMLNCYPESKQRHLCLF